MIDLTKYIGIPFKDHGSGFDGCDCYGLVSLLYRTEFGLYLPQVGDLYKDAYARKEVDKAVEYQVRNWKWCRIVKEGEPLHEFDMLVFRIAGTDHHVGLWIQPGYMLHVVEGCDSGIERYDGVRWKRQFHRVVRHIEYEKKKTGGQETAKSQTEAKSITVVEGELLDPPTPAVKKRSRKRTSSSSSTRKKKEDACITVSGRLWSSSNANTFAVLEGRTISEILRDAFTVYYWNKNSTVSKGRQFEKFLDRCRCRIDNREIPREEWDTYMPIRDSFVEFLLAPGKGGGGKNPLAMVLQVVVMVVAVVASVLPPVHLSPFLA